MTEKPPMLKRLRSWLKAGGLTIELNRHQVRQLIKETKPMTGDKEKTKLMMAEIHGMRLAAIIAENSEPGKAGAEIRKTADARESEISNAG